MSPGDDGSQSTWVFRDEEEDIPDAPEQSAPKKSSREIDEVDFQALAEEVYALLRQELRLERERQGWHKI